MDRIKLKQTGLVTRVAANLKSSMKDLQRCGHNRSSKSTFVEMGIQLSGFKHALSNQQAFDKLVKTAKEANSKPYVMPEVQFDVRLHQELKDGMTIYTLNDKADHDQRVIVYLAGGAYLNPADKTHWNYLNRLADCTDAKIVVPMYPLATTGNTFRAAYSQIAQLYVDLYSYTPVSHITIMGDSAGAGLALGFSEYLGQQGLPQPGHLILFSPWLDLDLKNPLIAKYVSMDSTLAPWGLREIGKMWAGDVDHDDYRLSPLNGDLSKLRNIHIYVGTREIMYPDTNTLVQKLRELGIPVKYHVGRHLFHSYPLYQMPEGYKVMEEVSDVVNEEAR
ncbi:MAG: alpha/beta hydrolase [Limosilactobacillus sp.]|uniref:alpha/beta hydrolase n=1 Tax=Limosilactobacillus sp. TaxID=2773925 RepID=UPI0027055D23|nr:alpha/beta hydrolase [Limosilactobacillus sp.]